MVFVQHGARLRVANVHGPAADSARATGLPHGWWRAYQREGYARVLLCVAPMVLIGRGGRGGSVTMYWHLCLKSWGYENRYPVRSIYKHLKLSREITETRLNRGNYAPPKDGRYNGIQIMFRWIITYRAWMMTFINCAVWVMAYFVWNQSLTLIFALIRLVFCAALVSIIYGFVVVRRQYCCVIVSS